MKTYFYEYKGKEYKADDPTMVADMLIDEVFNGNGDEELYQKILMAIANQLVNEYEEEEKITDPYEEQYFNYFDDGWARYRR